MIPRSYLGNTRASPIRWISGDDRKQILQHASYCQILWNWSDEVATHAVHVGAIDVALKEATRGHRAGGGNIAARSHARADSSALTPGNERGFPVVKADDPVFDLIDVGGNYRPYARYVMHEVANDTPRLHTTTATTAAPISS